MFNKENTEVNIKQAETIIGPSIKVKGNFHGKGNIIIEGQVEGSVKTDQSLKVGDKAIISANIEAKEASISGIVNGNVKINGYLEITNSAKISGDIEASLLSIEKGARLNGKCTMDSQRQTEQK